MVSAANGGVATVLMYGQNEDGSVRLLNAVSFEVESPEDLLGKIMLAKGRCATEATEKVVSRADPMLFIKFK